VVEIEGRLMGLVVDSASQVVRISADQIEPPPPVPGGFSQELITGIGKIGDRLVILLDADSILTVDEKIALSSVDAATSDRTAAH
jgi:purine-binding chemotaxis protein CheW